jgi:hypothetical protein
MNPYLIGGVAAAAFGAGFMVNGWRLNAQIESIHAAHAAAVVQANAEVMDQTVKLQGKKDAALKQAQQTASANAAAADRARSELEWVRDYNNRTANEIAGASCTSVRNHATAAAAVFAECSAAFADMARKADGHALDAKTLIQSWPTTESTK